MACAGDYQICGMTSKAQRTRANALKIERIANSASAFMLASSFGSHRQRPRPAAVPNREAAGWVIHAMLNTDPRLEGISLESGAAILK
ncbi:hypothetical protein GCM10011349_19730 [Novosphingobium indicum]|uniref:Short-chain dehydrogenase n=1 Tax=Novosphingobium indicum TaxID=462949 RepID=A0ABQ2JLU5_9SPHN|nr:hypothetical protein GCM10011349_19730 [Novosphingobium indicum]